MNQRETIIQEYIDAYNSFDINGMLQHLYETVHFENIVDGEATLVIDGIKNFKIQAEEASNLFSIRKQTIRSFKHTGDIVEAQLSYSAVLATDMPNGMKAGTELDMEGKSEFTFSGDKIIAIKDIS